MTTLHIFTLPNQATYERPLSTSCIEQIKALDGGIRIDVLDDD